ncbi:MAG: membrane dipeptidase [bacterium]|nr:membrane dipeptidase [bacterium]
MPNRAVVLAALIAASPVAPSLPGQQPNSDGANQGAVLRDVAYGPHERNRLDFWSAGGDEPRPLVIYIHGGGWVRGDKKSVGRQYQAFLENGIHFAAINYRRTDQHALPAPVHDAARAIQFLRTKADEWQIDGSRIGLMGGSAGACTSMWLLLHDDLADPDNADPVLRESTRVRAAAVWGGQTAIDPKLVEDWVGPKILDHDMIWRAVGASDLATVRKNYDSYQQLYREFSPYNHVTSDDPPLFMRYGSDMTLPSKNKGHGIHHPRLGVMLQLKSIKAGHECHLSIPGHVDSPRYKNERHFLLDKLLRNPEFTFDERARAIQAQVITLDTHKDIEPQLAPESLPEDPETAKKFREKYDPSVRGSQQVDFPKMREGGLDCAFFIVYVGQGKLTPAGYAGALRAANAKFDAIHRMARLHGDTIGLATSVAEVRALHEAGKLIACIGIENGYPMGEDLGLVAKFHARGARYMSIAHNRHSQLGDSHTPLEPLHDGLSPLGKRAIEEMNRVGIMVDISHAAKKTMLQALAHSKAPVIASHSGCRALCDHSRNLDNQQLRALRKNGGVIQVVALDSFLVDATKRRAAEAKLKAELGFGRDKDAPAPKLDLETRMQKLAEGKAEIARQYPGATVKDLVDHIDHAVRFAGINSVGIGSDFDGGGGIEGWRNASETLNVTRELVRRGYTKAQIEKIWSGNLLRVWRAVEKHAATYE